MRNIFEISPKSNRHKLYIKASAKKADSMCFIVQVGANCEEARGTI
jgi:hypothetical protein